MYASIILPTLNESARIQDCLDSLAGQCLIRRNPGAFEIITVDSGSSDNTRDIAIRYGAVLMAPRGKLTARTIGVANAKGRIIIAVDADTVYPDGWLRRMLAHFTEPSVVAISGPKAYCDDVITNLILLLLHFARPSHYMCGGNSAFRKDAFYATGGFAPTNQLDVRAMVHEEEGAFGDRLAQHGRYVYDYGLTVCASARRYFDNQHMAARARGERF